ncbi:STAS domain-containing protein [Streptomyces ipomoeae]|uniref:STAS domain-containing protein n=1 Tax=Streptomyces ipomoeae TaxID=103232 RepID=UPI001146BA6D|nr:STAS domain-containing protein [Streptomyces ipomoeae]MDX2933832.1 STAS domain-containing protein [Streptomyces ipomoeae]TQE28899.1 anti-sigma factor antagonist [Streptomyces ipomoeae]
MTSEAHDRAAGPPEGRADGPGLAAENAYARSRRVGPFTVVQVRGEIDIASAGFLAEHLTAVVTGAVAPDVLVDLRRVTFFDCSGLRVLCRAEATARAHGGRLRLVSDQPRIHRLLRAVRLLGRFPPLLELPSSPPPPPSSQQSSLK